MVYLKYNDFPNTCQNFVQKYQELASKQLFEKSIKCTKYIVRKTCMAPDCSWLNDSFFSFSYSDGSTVIPYLKYQNMKKGMTGTEVEQKFR